MDKDSVRKQCNIPETWNLNKPAVRRMEYVMPWHADFVCCCLFFSSIKHYQQTVPTLHRIRSCFFSFNLANVFTAHPNSSVSDTLTIWFYVRNFSNFIVGFLTLRLGTEVLLDSACPPQSRAESGSDVFCLTFIAAPHLYKFFWWTIPNIRDFSNYSSDYLIWGTNEIKMTVDFL